jgi:hypothetical protein
MDLKNLHDTTHDSSIQRSKSQPRLFPLRKEGKENMQSSVASGEPEEWYVSKAFRYFL